MLYDDAVTLLIRTATIVDDENSRHQAASVVKTLGLLALAIIQAGAYIRQKLCTVGEFCDKYSRQRQQLLEYRPVQDSSAYNLTVYTTWEISINKIRGMCNEAAQNALQLLEVFAFFHFDGISEEIFKKAGIHYRTRSDSELEFQPLLLGKDENSWDSLSFRLALAMLSSFSLVDVNETNRRISMHPLVHTYARDRLVETRRLVRWKTAAFTLAVSAARDLLDYKFTRLLIPHFVSCEESSVDAWGPGMFQVVYIFVDVYMGHGLLTRAVNICHCWLERNTRILSTGSADNGIPNSESRKDGVVVIRNCLAEGYLRLGHYIKAEEVVSETLSMTTPLEECKDEVLLESWTIMAKIYEELGRSEEALKLYEKVLDTKGHVLGMEHEETISSLNDLGRCCSETNRMEAALKLQGQALEIRKAKLGDAHPNTIQSMHQIVMIYLNIGEEQKALTLGKKTVQLSKINLGEEHVITLASMQDLAYCYCKIGQSQAALTVAEHVVKVRRSVSGDEHPNTLLSMRILSDIYSLLERPQDALELQQEVVRTSRKVLGGEAPETLSAMRTLGRYYRQLERRQEAVNMGEEVVKLSRKVLGAEHPKTIASMKILILYYCVVQRPLDAIKLLEEIINISNRILGDKHPDTLKYEHVLSSVREKVRPESELAELRN